MTCKRPSRHGIAVLCLITLILAAHALTHPAAACALTDPSTLLHLEENLGGRATATPTLVLEIPTYLKGCQGLKGYPW